MSSFHLGRLPKWGETHFEETDVLQYLYKHLCQNAWVPLALVPHLFQLSPTLTNYKYNSHVDHCLEISSLRQLRFCLSMFSAKFFHVKTHFTCTFMQFHPLLTYIGWIGLVGLQGYRWDSVPAQGVQLSWPLFFYHFDMIGQIEMGEWGERERDLQTCFTTCNICPLQVGSRDSDPIICTQ